ncbi:hypothetical protein NMG60_11020605 [Bertholletia excelsa]
MASSISLCSPLLPPRPSWGTRRFDNHRGRRVPAPISAARNEAPDGSGRLVDESMVVLRKRIHEMKMTENDYEPPSHWFNWEKSCYAAHDSIIYEAVGILQRRLMNTRPSLALGIMALVTMSVPTTVALILIHVAGTAKGVLGL